MKASEEDDFYCPLCGCNLLWMPVSRIFVCEHCKESFSESAKCYLRKKKDVTKGNQQKMREALDAALVFIGNLEIEPYSPLDEAASELRQRIIDALYAPPRNCDRFCSIEQAKAAYCEEVRNVFIWDGDESCRFEKWLLAPAAERKGEGDGSK